jgi:protein-glutamine gamma-glutamyltransferase
MSLALLHRRLAILLSLAAVSAFAAGAGWGATATGSAALLALGLVWRAGPALDPWVERLGRVLAILLFAWTGYVLFAGSGDILPPLIGILLVLLVTEVFRALDRGSDLRLYALSFSVFIAATGFQPGVAFGASFIAYVVLATLTLMVGHLHRQALAYDIPDPPLQRRHLALTAMLSLLALGMSALLFLSFPRLPRSWVGFQGTSTRVMAGFSETVSLGEHGSRITANDAVALRVEFPDGPPPRVEEVYLRGLSFDRFDGTRWSRSNRLHPQGRDRPAYLESWRGGLLRQSIYGAPAGSRAVFGIHPVVGLEPRGGTRVRLDAAGDLRFDRPDPGGYEVVSYLGVPLPAALEIAEDPGAPPHYLDLPALSPAVRALADSLTAGSSGRAQAAARVEAWLRTEFGYTLDLPRTAAEASLEHFLFTRREGHCEYFSTAMVVLLRAAGIPARNVTGFLGGEWNEFGGYLIVRQNRAHSWVEVWYPEAGWVPYDPTPPGGAPPSRLDEGWGRTLGLLDGLQHRWYKWVVDYNLQRQVEIFRGVGDAFRGGSGGRPDASLWGRRLLMGAGLLLLLAVIWRTPRPGAWRRCPPATRAYLRLRSHYAGRGVARRGPPAAFVAEVRAAGLPGADEAEEAVELYLRDRFGASPLDEGELGSLEGAVRTARRRLRAGPRE